MDLHQQLTSDVQCLPLSIRLHQKYDLKMLASVFGLLLLSSSVTSVPVLTRFA
jgi:hypothetical protein